MCALIAYYSLRPSSYFTGTNSVETYSYIAETPAYARLCVPGLRVPAGTSGIRLQLISHTRRRPPLRMVLNRGGVQPAIESMLGPATIPASRISAAVFRIPVQPAHSAERPASLCLTAADLVNWGGTPLPVPPPVPPGSLPPTVNGHPVAGRIAIWYLPPVGAEHSFLGQAGTILARAARFRPALLGPWLYVLVLLLVLPALAFASVRCLAVAAAGRSPARTARRLAISIFAIAAVNFACWAVITPPFQAPDEVDHFAYTQSLVERGQAPSRSPNSSLPRWSGSEELALEDASFFTDHQVGGTKLPWESRQEAAYRARAAALPPRSAANGGGNETAATHGAIYYAALAPAYMLASSSPFDQLTLMRLMSALIGALTALFTFLLARELAPGRPWLAVLAGLLVAYQPMYGFISGSVNNDVGVNAGAAALVLLLTVMLRRGVSLWLGLLTGGLLLALPVIKGTALSLYPVAAVALAATLLRHHRRSDLAGWAGLAIGAVVVRELSLQQSDALAPSTTPFAPAPAEAGSTVGAIAEARAHPLGYLGYVWQVFLPRLSFMAPHFETSGIPAWTIFVERGWGAFGWYDVFFPNGVYVAILVAMLAVPILAVIAAGREWDFVRRNVWEAVILLLTPIAVIAGFEAAFYTIGTRPFLPEFGRYAFPAIAPLSVLVVASLHAFGRRAMVFAGAGLLVGMVALSYASQLLTLTAFYA
jgi:hypothetical protein